jgi:polar amino acid transport system substrate-binding protein
LKDISQKSRTTSDPRSEQPSRQGQAIKGQLEIVAVEEAEIGNLELADIVDVKLLQSVVDDFHAVAHIPMSILDLNGKVLVKVGWQDICTRFHRANPESCKNCVASGIELPVGVKPGKYRAYKCKNRMWDVVTPLMLRETHVGNLFSGQFFFDNEELEYAAFRAQAQQYGFNEEQYIAALEAVPRLSREHVNTCMAFLTKLAHMISQMSYSNMELARSLAEHKRSQAALIQSEKLAAAGRLAATIAHEINNPLEAVTNCIYLTSSSPKLDPELKEHLGTAERELQRVAKIAKQTLGFYRENTKPSMVDIRTLVDEVVELYHPKFKSKDIRLSIEHDGCCGQLFAVGGEIRQVISNLLVNAVEASKSKGSVKIRTSRIPLSGSTYTRVTVADTGTGISAASRSHIFEPFFTSKAAVGTGLGLWVSRQIVEKHKGSIRVRSVEGKGTVFSVFLPDLQAEDLGTVSS